MKSYTSKFFSLLLVLAALLSLCILPVEADAYSTPRLEITRRDMDPIAPGEEFTLTVLLSQSASYTTIRNPSVTFSPSEAFMIVDPTPTKTVADFRRNEQVPVKIKLKAMSKITNPVQSVQVTVNFDYVGVDDYLTSGSTTETIFIPVVTNADVKEDAPRLVITRGEVETISAKEDLALHVFVRNDGLVPVTDTVLTVSPDSSLLITDPTQSRLLGAIQPGETLDVLINLQAKSELSESSLSVGLKLNYDYTIGEKASGEASETVFIPAVVTPRTDTSYTPTESATPNVIIRQYSIGDDPSVAAGSTFDLTLEFENTSTLFTVENIVMTVSPGEGLSIASGSNTVHYPSLKPGATQDQTVSILVLPTAKTGAAKLDVSFSYEYVENRTRKHVNPSQSIAIPIYQPDRFEVELPNMPEMVDAYNEMYISMPYVNKGKSEVSNIRAEIISEDGAVTSINPVQNLGNFASGASGSIDFIFTPQMPGEVSFSFRITYEDPNAKEKVLDFPVTLNVSEPYYPSFDDPIFPEPGFDVPVQKQGLPWWVWVLIGLVVVLAVVLILVKRGKKRKAAKAAEQFLWEDEEDAEEEVPAGGSK